MTGQPPIPGTLRIGHARYTVTVSDQVIDRENTADHANYAGFSQASKQHIVLREDNPPDFQAETLLHEVLHQCLRVSGCDPDSDAKAGVTDVEERAVRSMAGALLATMRDNPGFVAYLTADTTSPDPVKEPTREHVAH